MTLHVSLSSAAPNAPDAPMLAILLDKAAAQAGVPAPLTALDSSLGGALARALADRDFRGGRDETYALGGAGALKRVLLVGMGAPTLREMGVKRAASVAARQAHRAGVGRLALWSGGAGAEVEALASGAMQGAWEYVDLKTQPPADERRAPLTECVILASGADAALASGLALGEGQALARRLAMMPGNVCTPALLEATAREIAGRHGMKVTVLGRAEMEAEKMGSFLAVAQGTPQEPRLVAVEHRKGPRDGAPIVLVGKGLCFDSGGISIKPAQGMEMMKFDMCGAAGVLGALDAIGRMGLAVNVVGIIGATTNMPSGTAVNPGDVVRSAQGTYIEVINTDAEGRLVLADCLHFAKRFAPAAVIDAATLTGACVVALGNTATGVFGTDQALVDEVLEAGRRAAEPGWQLPMWDEYKDLIKSDTGDIKNSGGRAAGSITAALFLKEFTEGFPWVHLDIAGTAYSETDLVSMPKGPTGNPVGTFVEFVRGRSSGGV